MKSSPATFYFRCRVALLCISILLPVAGCVASDSAKRTESATCELQVIVRFKDSVDPTHPGVLSQIGSRIHAMLRYGRALGGEQYVIQLSADSSCENALSALQHDAQVASAEPDTMNHATH
jgi:hypothetical protein